MVPLTRSVVFLIGIWIIETGSVACSVFDSNIVTTEGMSSADGITPLDDVCIHGGDTDCPPSAVDDAHNLHPTGSGGAMVGTEKDAGRDASSSGNADPSRSDPALAAADAAPTPIEVTAAGMGGNGGTAGAAGPSGAAGTSDTSGTSGTGGSSTVSDAPLCSAVPLTAAGVAPLNGGACTASDPQACYNTCGPISIGYKKETCTNGKYVEQEGCTFSATGDYSCYKIPSQIDATCPTAAPQAAQPCTINACVLCNVNGRYLDSKGNSKLGYCVCREEVRTWSCASTTAWPCPDGNGC
jgi:hypothetical protein